jgi:hypothetical protein
MEKRLGHTGLDLNHFYYGTIVDRVSVKTLGSGVIIIFYDIQLCVSNG